MPNVTSKTQIDRLGERLAAGQMTEADLRLLDTYRRSFTDPYGSVVRLLRDELALMPTGRPAKSTSSIVEKLRRESIRLSQMQDIAGCRVIVTDVVEQDQVVERLKAMLPQASIVDRRIRPSHGYRAVHIITSPDGHDVEIQIRTALQHLWAELSEKLADVIDPAIKYGRGSAEIRAGMSSFSDGIAKFEAADEPFRRVSLSVSKGNAGIKDAEKRLKQIRKRSNPALPEVNLAREISHLRESLNIAKSKVSRREASKKELRARVEEMIRALAARKSHHAVSD